MVFKPVDTKVSFPALELEVEAGWRADDVVRKALEHGDRARPFIFFEGPPTANGRPGVHHIEARASKDIVVRFHRMKGEYVIGARGGWDVHGLPVEIEVERELGFKGNQYIESLWWILKTLREQDLLFRDYKVTMHCPRCGTSLSDHEVSLGFEDDVDDPSVWLRFRHRPSGHALDEQLAGSAFLAWTTTPWTLPANVALAVKPGAAYVLVERTFEGGGQEPVGKERLVLAEALAPAVLGEHGWSVVATFQGEELVGSRFENLFDGVPATGDKIDPGSAYRVIAD